jgi:hypothetical protein
MYEVIEKIQESSGQWRVRVVVSEKESMFLWFSVEPDQHSINSVIDQQLKNRLYEQALANPIVESVNTSACSAWQMRKALNATGLRDAIETAVSASGDQTVKDGWEYATEFERYDPLVLQFGAALGKTDIEMDELFELARGL